MNEDQISSQLSRIEKDLILPKKYTVKDQKTGREVFEEIAQDAGKDIDIETIKLMCQSIASRVESELYNKCYHDLYVIRDDIGQDFLVGEIDFDSRIAELASYYERTSISILEIMQRVYESACNEYNSIQSKYNEIAKNAAAAEYQNNLGGN